MKSSSTVLSEIRFNQEAQINQMSEKNITEKKTIHDRVADYIKNNKPIVAIVLVASVLAGGKEVIESTEFLVVKANSAYRYVTSLLSTDCSELEMTPKEYSECVLKQ